MASILLTLALLGSPQADAPTPPAHDPVAFDRCLDRLQRQAESAGVAESLFDLHVRPVVPDTSVLRLLDAQPEFTTPIWDYLAGLVDDERVADGKAMLAQHSDTLARVEAEYGVDPATVVAVWGVESDFGRVSGGRARRASAIEHG